MEKTKEQLVDEILSNSVYQPDSGVIVQLRVALLKMSKSNLYNLLLIIGIKKG